MVIPISFVKNYLGIATFCLLYILVGRIIGFIMIIQHLITWVANKLVNSYCWVNSKLFRSSTATRLKPIIMKSIAAHRERNTKFGMMFITTVMFFMVL